MVDLANSARTAGFYGVSLPEDLENCSADVFLTFGALSQRCKDLTFLTSAVNQYSRHPVALGVAALQCYEMCGGRFILGLGSGSPSTMNALSLDGRAPLARLREVVKIVRSLSTDNEVNFEGDFFKVKSVKSLRGNKRIALPIYIPGIRDRAIRLAATIGDGIILSNFSSIEYVKHATKIIASTPRASGTSSFGIACNMTYIPADDQREGLKLARPFAERYLSFPGIGETLLEKSGFDPKISGEIRKGNYERVSPEIVEAMVVFGKPDRLFDSLHSLEKLGVSLAIIGTDPAYLDKVLSIDFGKKG